MSKVKSFLFAFSAGLLNGLFGAGGGIIAVKALQHEDLSDKSAHATAVAVMAILSAVSVFLCLRAKVVTIGDVFPFLPGGIAGALFGGWLLPKIPGSWLRKVFSLFIIYAAVRLFLR